MTTPTAGGAGHADATMDGDAARREVRAWIDRHFDRTLSLRAWPELLADPGWAKPTRPAEWFGKCLTTDLAAIAYAELAKAGARPPAVSAQLAARDHRASDDLKRRLVRAILIGDHAWCQLFSEPGPAPTWRACRHAPSATATSSWSTGEGNVGARSPTTAC